MNRPIPFEDLEVACLKALMISIEEQVPVYVYHHTNGVYIVDTSGEIYSNEKLVCTYFDGEKQ